MKEKGMNKSTKIALVLIVIILISLAGYSLYKSRYLAGKVIDSFVDLTSLTRQPVYYQDMQKFVRPEEAEKYLSNFNFGPDETIQEDVERIMLHSKIYYSWDKADYWQTPAETLKTRRGDCEDWAIAKLSLARAYNRSVDCYAVLWETHVGVLCRIDKKFTIYDQKELVQEIVLEKNPSNDYIINQENSREFREGLNRYFDRYGLDADERKIYALFNEKELIIFDSNEKFVEWALSFVK